MAASSKKTLGSFATLGAVLGGVLTYVGEHHVIAPAQAQQPAPALSSSQATPIFATSADFRALALEVRAYRGEVAGVLKRLERLEGDDVERRAEAATLRTGGGR